MLISFYNFCGVESWAITDNQDCSSALDCEISRTALNLYHDTCNIVTMSFRRWTETTNNRYLINQHSWLFKAVDKTFYLTITHDFVIRQHAYFNLKKFSQFLMMNTFTKAATLSTENFSWAIKNSLSKAFNSLLDTLSGTGMISKVQYRPQLSCQQVYAIKIYFD